jgi:hypothetical protein
VRDVAAIITCWCALIVVAAGLAPVGEAIADLLGVKLDV